MKHSTIWFLPMMTLISLVGCGSLFGVKTKNLHFDYEKPMFGTEFGAFYTSFTSEPKMEIIDSKEVVVWTDPYMFNTQYYTEEPCFRSGEITNLKVLSMKTGEVIFEHKGITDLNTRRRGRASEELELFAAFGVEIPKMEYEDYRVTFNYAIYAEEDTVFEAGTVDVVVQTNYFEKRK